jgi:type I restriction enzyme, S subunit
MVSEWEEVTIGDVCFLGDGAHAKVQRTDFGVPYLTSKNIGNGSLKLDSLDHISEMDYERLFPVNSRAVTRLKSGDILTGIIGTFGNLYLYKESDHFGISSAVAIVRPDQTRVWPRYLYYYLTSSYFRQKHASYAAGSVQGYTNLPTIRQLPAIVPPLAEQKAIAAILGALDDKIELNRRMNATLEGMARALFQSWFVDFDPVRAKLDGRKPEGIDKATAALFPDAFEESSLGPVPKGWKVRSLDKTAHYLNGLALQKYPPGDGPTLPVIKIAQLRKGDSFGADRCNNDLPSNYIVQDGDVLFSWSGSLEVELWCGGPGALNQHLFKVSSLEFPKWFYYLWTLYHLEEFRLIAAAKATTMGHIQRSHLTAANVIISPAPLLDAMTRIMSPLIDQLIANRIQSRTLATLRDTLLPKLLSGELNVASIPKVTK